MAFYLNALARLYSAHGQYAKAKRLYERSLAIRKKALGPEHLEVAESLTNLAALYQTQGQYAKAEPLYRRSLAIFGKALGPEHPDVASALNNLAALHFRAGRNNYAGLLAAMGLSEAEIPARLRSAIEGEPDEPA